MLYSLVAILISTAVGLQGDGYVELPGNLLPHAADDVVEDIAMMFSTDQPDGIMFWHGQEEGVSGRGSDYLAIALSNGHAVFRWDQGTISI